NFRWGPRHGPQAPQRSQRPGGAVALLWIGWHRGARHGPQALIWLGAPTMPPSPPTFAAPRRSRGASLDWWASWGPTWPPSSDLDGGPEMAPKSPNAPAAPAEP